MRKNTILLLALFLGSQMNVIAQKLHSPAEIIALLEKSELGYMINLMEEEILPKNRNSNLNLNDVYRKVDGNSIKTIKYEVNEGAKEHTKTAEKHFGEGNYDYAREYYLKALEEDPEYYKIMTYVGQICGIDKDYNTAIKWYKKTIDLNYIDYMAHWFLSSAYKKKGMLDEAVKEITIAMVLNRNNPRIKKSFEEIYTLKKLQTPEWVFTPQIKLDSISEKEVSVAFGEDWLGYAMAKALWKFEPGYSESMGVKEGTFSTMEEKEALIALFASLTKKKLKKNPEFKALDKAVNNNDDR